MARLPAASTLRMRPLTPFLLALLLLLPGPVAAEEQGAPGRSDPGLGWEYDLSGAVEEFLLPDALTDPSIDPTHPLLVRIRVPWASLEHSPGDYDWSEVDRIVDPYRAAGYVVSLSLYGSQAALDPQGGVPLSSKPALLKGWLDVLRAAAQHFRGRVRTYEVGARPNLEPGWRGAGVAEYAYVLKASSVTIRSADPEARVAQGALDLEGTTLEEALQWQASLYRAEVSTYVDVLPLRNAPGAPLNEAVERAYGLMLDHDPSAHLWVVQAVPHGEGDRDRAADLMRQFIVARGEGADLVSFELEADVEGRPEFPGLLLDLHKLFLPGYARRPGPVSFTTAGAEASGPVTGLAAYRFFDAKTYQGLVAYFTHEPPRTREAVLVLDTAAVKGVALYDLVGGTAGPIAGATADFRSNSTRVPVTLRTRPLIVLFARVPIEGFESAKEQVAVADTGLITVEEIIANHQRFMADQDFRLRHYRASGRVAYHYKISASNTIDVAYDNAFFWEHARGAEWQQTAMYINGVRWKGTKFPDIPFIQPEKVVSLPLDISLGAEYEYRYVGPDSVDGYDCYVVAFQPREPGRSLYEGKVWIESRTFARVRLSVVQHGLEAPVTSNDERDRYAPVAGPDGTTYWLLNHVEGQQIFTTAGRNLVVLREIDLGGFQINDPGFEAAREQAYSSTAPILRDTDQGMRYLTRGPDGERTLEQEPTRKTLFALGGVYTQPGLDTPVPLLGVDYFNYNIGGRNLQLNAFLAGLINLVTLTDPKLFGPFDGSVEAQLLGFDLTDTVYVRGEKREESNVDRQNQAVSAWLGLPLGNFFRLRGEYAYEYVNSSRDEETESFVEPADTSQHGLRLHGEFNRAGWSVTASAGRTWRQDWEPWGDESPPSAETLGILPAAACDTPGSCLSEFDPSQDSFRTQDYTIAKQFFLPAFQKIRVEASWYAGSNLDRFSEFAFDFFGTRVRGFSGAGVRYDRGGIARLQYAFNIQDLVRFEASLDHGYVKDSLTSGDFAQFTGFGVSGNVLGPWQTILSFDVGVPVHSDYEDLRGGTELQVVLFKFF
ncbi:MAG TPA: hypothetical protein VFB95_11350 [Candidatus Cryosericum sp.]|nr:hypothetical protein [Candidatus Cryosericum sp.]